jgi:hypothetical protein
MRGSVGFGNARAVRNLIEASIKRQSARVLLERRTGMQGQWLHQGRQVSKEDLLEIARFHKYGWPEYIINLFVRYFWQGNHQKYGHVRCTYMRFGQPYSLNAVLITSSD